MAGANGPSVTEVAAFGVVLAGFLFGLTSMQAGPRLPAPWRAVSAAVFAVLVSIVVAWLVGPVFGALPASFLMTGTLAGLLPWLSASGRRRADGHRRAGSLDRRHRARLRDCLRCPESSTGSMMEARL